MQYPKRIIEKGETNKAIVRAIQQKLTDAGLGTFEGTGNFGPKTTNAIKLFQATHRDVQGNPLTIDGRVGSITWEILFGEETVVVKTDTPNNLLSEALAYAISQIGVMEEPPGSNRGPKVNEYLKSVNCTPGSFWCAAFVYYCFSKASEKLGKANPLYKTGHCMTHWNKTPGKKILAADAVNNPSLLKPGQIFIINTGGSSGHTGFVERIEGGFIHTIEGNSDPTGGRNGIGVFRNTRKINKINRGFLEYK